MAREAEKFRPVNEPITQLIRPTFTIPGPFNNISTSNLYVYHLESGGFPFTINVRPSGNEIWRLDYALIKVYPNTGSLNVVPTYTFEFRDEKTNTNVVVLDKTTQTKGDLLEWTSATIGPASLSKNQYIQIKGVATGASSGATDIQIMVLTSKVI